MDSRERSGSTGKRGTDLRESGMDWRERDGSE